MTLIELFLPMYDSQGNGLEKNLKAISDELTERFGGVTAFVQSPAEGSWLKDNEVKKDEIAVYEIMVETLDKKWWRTYATTLEMNLKQKEILIRATQMSASRSELSLRIRLQAEIIRGLYLGVQK